jgi:putative addiction module component (TIGR02574 family)
MTPKSILEQALRLPVAERIDLVEQLWDSIAAASSQVPVPEWHKAELDRRLAEPNAERLTWDEVQKRLGEPE